MPAPAKPTRSSRARGNEVTSDHDPDDATWTEPVPLTIAQQKAFVRSIGRGGSPAIACADLGVSLESAALSVETDARFRARLERAFQSLTDNVRAAVYREALRGKVPAQALWFRETSSHRENRALENAPPDLPGTGSPQDLLDGLTFMTEALKLISPAGDSQ